MEIVDAIKIINQMQADGVIRSYAIGGAVRNVFLSILDRFQLFNIWTDFQSRFFPEEQ